jgi:uncharacterized protein YggL (DUF469 family)
MALKPNGRFRWAVKETREHLQINSDPDADDEDAIEHLMDECGQDSSGGCSMVGTEYCDWECPFSS